MAAYVIADIDVKDPAGYEEYKRLAAPTIQQYGGRYLVRAPKVEKLEGGWEPKRLVILEFPSVEQAKRWYQSQEYRKALGIRHRTAVSNVLLVEGA